jgi:hypothetical protein
MSPFAHKLTDAEGALLDEIAALGGHDHSNVAIKDLELRLEDRGFTENQTRRALMSLLRRGQLVLAGGKFVARKSDGDARAQSRPGTS